MGSGIKLILLFALALTIHWACKKRESKSEPQAIFVPLRIKLNPLNHSGIISKDNQVLICCKSEDSICLTKYSRSGKIIWQKRYFSIGISDEQGITDLTQDASGNIYITGILEFSQKVSKVFLFKTNAKGDLLWNKVLTNQFFSRMIVGRDGNILLTGGTYTKHFLVRLDPNGDSLRTSYFDTEPFSITHMLETGSGDILISGNSGWPKRSAVLLLSDAAGQLKWRKEELPKNAYVNATQEMPDGNFYSIGAFNGNSLIFKSSSQGILLWKKEIGDNEMWESFQDLVVNKDGSFNIVGTMKTNIPDNYHVIFMHADGEGNIIKARRFSGSNLLYTHQILKDEQNNNVILGIQGMEAYLLNTDHQGICLNPY